MQATRYILLLLAISCAHTPDPLIVSGEALVTLGQEFTATSKAIDIALEHHKVTAAEYNKWVSFANKFQLVYPQLCSLWDTARLLNDDNLQVTTVDAIFALGKELAVFSINAHGGINGDSDGGN